MLCSYRPLQRVVLLPADETLLVRCLRRSLQAVGQHFAFACENGVLRALTGNVIVRCSWFYPPDPFDLDAIRKLSPCSSRSCQRKRPWLRSLCRKGRPGSGTSISPTSWSPRPTKGASLRRTGERASSSWGSNWSATRWRRPSSGTRSLCSRLSSAVARTSRRLVPATTR